MMSFSSWGSVLEWVFKRVDQVSKFFKKKNRRGNVQGFDKAIRDRNAKYINNKLRKLRDKVKNRDDSR